MLRTTYYYNLLVKTLKWINKIGLPCGSISIIFKTWALFRLIQFCHCYIIKPEKQSYKQGLKILTEIEYFMISLKSNIYYSVPTT